MVLKPANKYQIFWQDDKYKKFLLTVTSFSYFFLKQKFIKHHFLWSRNNITAKQRRLTIEAFIYYLIYSGVRKVFHKIMSTHVL